ncbi:MAG: 16S rRNA (uracil(1498)-N(3))-methyltransferase [Bacteroidetes bacterium]|nr:16S rRNA (uracil(1498)-N(3))-methyltransferase [Bacteroidota bacterium]
MQLFFVPDILTGNNSLNDDESRHCIKVLRLKKNDFIHITDGKGNLFKAQITDNNSKKCNFSIVETTADYGNRNYKLHIGIAPTKNIDRIEWFLEKATEIGIDEITPVICEHSERRTVNTDRLNRIIISAMKQSLKAYMPLLNKEKKFNEFITNLPKAPKYIGYCNDDTVKLKNVYTPKNDAIILIGPEGDFSETEINSAKKNDFISINLGNNRYRTETAALMACHTIFLMNE